MVFSVMPFPLPTKGSIILGWDSISKGIICFIYVSRPLIMHLGITGIINSFAVSSNELLEVACVYAQLLSHVQLFATQGTTTHQDLLSMEFSRQEYWSGLPFPTPGDLPDLRIKSTSFMSSALAGRSFTTSITNLQFCW